MTSSLLLLGDISKEDIRENLEKFAPLLEPYYQVHLCDIFSLKEHLSSLSADLAVLFSGDGTMLYAGRMLCPKRIPILGVNRGKLGFLTELSPQDFEKNIGQDFLAHFRISRHLILEVTLLREGKETLKSPCINDVVVSFHGFSRIIPVRCYLNEEYITTYYGDGVIVATPIGSTAYSLSAGGPIVSQEMEATLLTPICPHTLNNRPLIIPSKTQVSLQVEEPFEDGVMTIDGQISAPIDHTCRIQIRKYRFPFLRLKPPQQTFFKTLKEKLRWAEPPNYSQGS